MSPSSVPKNPVLSWPHPKTKPRIASDSDGAIDSVSVLPPVSDPSTYATSNQHGSPDEK
jgi:hypothetical protein